MAILTSTTRQSLNIFQELSLFKIFSNSFLKYFWNQIQYKYKIFYKNATPVDKNMKLYTFNHTTIPRSCANFELRAIWYEIFNNLIFRPFEYHCPTVSLNVR